MTERPKDKLLDLCRLALVLGLGLFLLLGLGRTLLRPMETNYYENRPAARLAGLSLRGFLDGSFQDSLEDALADQVPGALRLKKTYNDASSALLLRVLRRESAAHPELFYRYNGVYIRGDRAFWDPFDPEPLMGAIQATAEGFNRAMAGSELPFYFYFVESDAVLDMKTGEKTPFYELVCSLLDIPAERCARFLVDDPERFCQEFFRTDHHWNARGSYRGYREILALLGCEEAPLEPLEERTLPGELCGSKALQAGLTELTEPFTAYRFAYPPLGVSFGHEEEFFAGTCPLEIGYGSFYGGDDGLVVFDTGREDRPDLLIIGDSYDNAVLKLIASHHHRTYAVDLRNYAREQGEPFRLDSFAREHHLDAVLILGSQVVFCGDYILEG
ncbi:MAG: hypothetical protein IK095_07425 [Oscillospiraceae bacterium]|nr:hypothetical protein [Oscillospiraceae bacterium]